MNQESGLSKMELQKELNRDTDQFGMAVACDINNLNNKGNYQRRANLKMPSFDHELFELFRKSLFSWQSIRNNTLLFNFFSKQNSDSSFYFKTRQYSNEKLNEFFF